MRVGHGVDHPAHFASGGGMLHLLISARSIFRPLASGLCSFFPHGSDPEPKKAPATAPTRLVVALMAAAALVASFHLKIASTETNAAKPNPVRTIQSPYLILICSTCSHIWRPQCSRRVALRPDYN